jgi:hypothetical protein
MKTDDLGVEKYEIDAWRFTLGSAPIKRVAHCDLSEPYEMREAHVFKLENGKYALVTEEGCSCYESSDADIDLFSGKKDALEAFEKWKKASG